VTASNPASPVVLPADGSPAPATPALTDPASFEVYNTGTKIAYWGGDTVTSGIGVPIAVGTGRTFDLQPGDRVYCCTDGTGAGEVRVGEVNG
jgi:cell wall-associated NlpC family hydrolase